MNYKELSNEDKIAAIAEWGFWPCDLHTLKPYIEALEANDSAVIEEYESFGDDPGHIVRNKARHDRASSVFGFSRALYDEHG